MREFELISIDLDGTIAEVITEEYILKHLAPDKLTEYQRLEKELKKRPRDAIEIIRKEFELLTGLNVMKIEAVINEIPLIKNAEKAVLRMKEDGFITVLLTDNPDVFCKPILKRVPFDYMVCTETIVKNNEIVGFKKFNIEKEKGLYDFLIKKKIDPSKCIHIGDWINDIPVFDMVGFGVALNPRNFDTLLSAHIGININDLLIAYDIIKAVIECI